MDFFIQNKDIRDLSKFNTPAIAQYYFEINSLEDIERLSEVYNFAQNNNIQMLIIWGGTNVLFAFDYYEWIIVKNNLKWWSYNDYTKILEAYSSESIRDISRILEEDDGQDIWHRFIGLPWSIGWAVYGNAGCFWLETENNFLESAIKSKQQNDLYAEKFAREELILIMQGEEFISFQEINADEPQQ